MKAFEEFGRMTASVAPGQPEKVARSRGVRLTSALGLGKAGVAGVGIGNDGEDGDAAAAAVGDDQRAHVGGDAGEAGLLAGAGDTDLAALVEVDHADGVGAAVGDVGAMAGGFDVDEVGKPVDGDGGDDAVGAGVDHGD